MHEPTSPRDLAVLLGDKLAWGAAALALTALLALLVDAGWGLVEGALGAFLGACAVGLACVLMQQRSTRQGSP